MVQFRAIDRRRAPQEIMRNFTQLAARVQKEVYRDMAQDIATRSSDHVDTGTYASGHVVGQRSGSFAPTETTAGKPQGVASGPPTQAGLSAMRSGIDGLPDSAENVVFRNRAVHAEHVERRFRIYAQAQSAAPAIIRAVAARLGLKTGGGA